MAITLHQQKGRDYRKFSITPEALRIERKTIGSYNAYQLDWEAIGFDAVVRGDSFDPRRTFLLIAIFFNVVLSLWVVWLLWAGIRGTAWFWVPAVLILSVFVYPVYLLSKQEFIKVLYGDNNVTFYYRPEDRTAVDAFIANMKVMHAAYLRERFLQLDDLLPLDDQVKLVQQLYLDKLISRNDLVEVMAEVKMRRLLEG